MPGFTMRPPEGRSTSEALSVSQDRRPASPRRAPPPLRVEDRRLSTASRATTQPKTPAERVLRTDNLAGELGWDEDERIEAHLAGGDQCARIGGAYAQVCRDLRETPLEPEPSTQPQLDRLRARLDSDLARDGDCRAAAAPTPRIARSPLSPLSPRSTETTRGAAAWW